MGILNPTQEIKNLRYYRKYKGDVKYYGFYKNCDMYLAPCGAGHNFVVVCASWGVGEIDPMHSYSMFLPTPQKGLYFEWERPSYPPNPDDNPRQKPTADDVELMRVFVRLATLANKDGKIKKTHLHHWQRMYEKTVKLNVG